MASSSSPVNFVDKSKKPLTRKVKVSPGILSPYRLLVLIRMVVLALFLAWRVQHTNPDAMWLWEMSVVCEIWFAFSWILDQLPKLCPINRTTDLQVLKEKSEMASPANPDGRSDLPGVDVFVSSADPEKEPPLTTSNTVLSILAGDYPLEKLTCYLSDDGGSLLLLVDLRMVWLAVGYHLAFVGVHQPTLWIYRDWWLLHLPLNAWNVEICSSSSE